MSVGRGLGELLDRFVLSSPQQRALRLVALAGALLFVAVVPAAGGGFHPLLSAPAVLLAAAVALAPESGAALWLVLWLGALWVLAVPRTLGPGVVVAAAALGAVHLAATVAGAGPPGLTLDRVLLRRWGARSGLCLGLSVVVWIVAGVLSAGEVRPADDLLAAGLVVAVVGVVFARARLLRSGSRGDPLVGEVTPRGP